MAESEKTRDSQARPVSADRILERLRNLCSRREYCTSDIRSKALSALGDRQDDAEKIVASLVRDRYVDDLRYASAFARDKAALAGWGEAKIRYALAAKKIDRETVSAALDAIDDTKAADRLQKLLENKFRALSSGRNPVSGYELRQKLLRFAVSRGYSFEQAASVVGNLVSGE